MTLDGLVVFVAEEVLALCDYVESLVEIIFHLVCEFELRMEHLTVHFDELLPEVDEEGLCNAALALEVHHLEGIDELLMRFTVVDHIIVDQVVEKLDCAVVLLLHDVEKALTEERAAYETEHLLERRLVQLIRLLVSENLKVLHEMRDLLSLATKLETNLALDRLS